MKIKRTIVFLASLMVWIEGIFANITVSNVQVFSGKPWRDVVIGYTLSGNEERPVGGIEVTAKDRVAGKIYTCTTLEGVDLNPGKHVIKWNASADGVKFKSDDVVFNVKILSPPLYCVIDLSGGSSAVSYPVQELSEVPNGQWTYDYKTTKLVLRRIEAGRFKMEDRYVHGHDVVLTKSYYIGVFEVTQRQWELVMGDRPSYFNNDSCYTSRPVERISYDMIRGASDGGKWPKTNSVDATSFLGKLRAKTGITFDLPTEAQWEYACRAGTTTDYNNGTDCSASGQDSNMNILGRYWYNGGRTFYTGETGCSSVVAASGTAKVGTGMPNAWGLYDMHGNVWEWCLDWWDMNDAGGVAVTDPKGGEKGIYRILRGGCYKNNASECTSSAREAAHSDRNHAGNVYEFCGFRLVRPIP